MDVYLARQPICNRQKKTVAYEMLYRSSPENRYSPEWDGTDKTKKLIHNMMLNFGFDYVTQGKRAFLNFTDILLLGTTPFLLPADSVVIELLEDIVYTPELIERLKILHTYGYTLALDDYTGEEIPNEVLRLVQMIKVDWSLTSHQQRLEIVKKFKNTKSLLAEKIETETQFIQAKNMGFDYFQGYYFAHPSLHFKKTYDISVVTYIHLWEQIASPSVDYTELGKIVERDVGATYKLLCKANTLQYFHTHRVHSVQHALMIMGSDEVRRWILLVLLNNLSDGHNEEAIQQALIRAVFSERIAELCGFSEYAHLAYLVGMFSVIDDESKDMLHQMVESGPALREIKETFSGKNPLMSELLQFTLAYEKNYIDAQAGQLPQFMKKYDISDEAAAREYIRAVCYAEQAFCLEPANITPEMEQKIQWMQKNYKENKNHLSSEKKDR